MLVYTDLPRKKKAAHSIYFDVVSGNGWVGLTLSLMIGANSWLSCSWLIRRSRDRRELAWANVLGKRAKSCSSAFNPAGMPFVENPVQPTSFAKPS